MRRFSERYGYKPIKKRIQIESIDKPLRNGLWNLLKLHCWDNVRPSSRRLSRGYYLDDPRNEEIRKLCRELWLNYFKEPLDQLSNDWFEVYDRLKKYFFSCPWYEVYDFIEFVANNYDRYLFKEDFTQECNNLLKKEMSAHRFVDGVITRITNEHEIAEVEQAIEEADDPISEHLRRALELMSDRNAPDYRNSIKESISAVEGLVAIVLKADKGTLGQLLKKLEDEIDLHPALKKAFSHLYGYASDEGGIRHALMGGERVDFNDAKFMLVVCSAFVNFVREKIQNNDRVLNTK